MIDSWSSKRQWTRFFERKIQQLRPFLSFKRQEGVFWAFRPEDEVKHSNDPQESPLKFDGGFFEPIKFFLKIFFTGSLTGNESETHGFDQSTESI